VDSVRRRREILSKPHPKGFLDWKDEERNMPRAEGIEPLMALRPADSATVAVNR